MLHNLLAGGGTPVKAEDYHPLMAAKAERERREMEREVVRLTAGREHMSNEEIERIWREVNEDG